MRKLASFVAVASLVVSSTMLLPAAKATMVIAPQVTGHVTSLPGPTLIVVDGHQYLVAVNSAAFKTLQTLHVGDAVGLMLDGPAKSSASHVTSILPSH